MEYIFNYCKQLISIILSITMVVTSMPADAFGRFYLAPPGTGNAVEQALQRFKVQDNSADEESPKEIPGLHEGRFRFDERAFTHRPDFKTGLQWVAKSQYNKAKLKVQSIFNGVRNRFVHEAVYDFMVENLGSLADGRYSVIPRRFNNSILPTAICYKNGLIEVNAHFIRFVAFLNEMGLNKITNDSGRRIKLLDNIIFSIAHCMIRGHFVISDNLAIEYDADYEESQSERGTDRTRLMNIDAILFYWLSLCENRVGDNLHQRVVDFLKETDEETGESYYELLGLRESNITYVAKRVCKLAEWSNHCRPEIYVSTGETKASVYRKTKEMYKEKLYMIEQPETDVVHKITQLLSLFLPFLFGFTNAEITPVAVISISLILMVIVGYRNVVEMGILGICSLVGRIEALFVMWESSKDKTDNSIDSTSISWRDEPEVIYYPFSSFDVEEILDLLKKFPNVEKIVVETKNIYGLEESFLQFGAQNIEFLILKTRKERLSDTDDRSDVILDISLLNEGGRRIEIVLIENDMLQDSTPVFKEKTVYFIHPWNKKDLGIHYYPVLKDMKKGDYLYISSDLLNNDGYRATSLPFIFFGPSMVGLEEVERSRGFETNFLNIAIGDIVFKKVKKISPERYREVYYADLYFAIYNDPILPTLPFFPELELGVLTFDEIELFMYLYEEVPDCILIRMKDNLLEQHRQKAIVFEKKLKDIERNEILRIFQKGRYHTQLNGYKRIFWRIRLKNFLELEKSLIERFIERLLSFLNAQIAREKCTLGPIPYTFQADNRLVDKVGIPWLSGLAEGVISSPFQLTVYLLKQIEDFEKKLNDVKLNYTTRGKGYLNEDNEKEKLLNLIQAMLKQFQKTAYLCSQQELIELGEVINEKHREHMNKNSYLATLYGQLKSICNTALVYVQNKKPQTRKDGVMSRQTAREFQYSL